MKHLCFTTAFLLLLLKGGFPQFLGGNADGYGAFTSAVSTINTQSFYCGGGNADGFTNSSSAVIIINNQNLYCSGGNGDGFDKTGSTASILNNQLFYCAGGNDDGYNNNGSNAVPFNNQLFYCAGGNGDGYDETGSTAVALNNQLYYCSGGNDDGNTVNGWSGSWVVYALFCNGGNGDGHMSGSAFSGTLNDQLFYCDGGNGDGYHQTPSAILILNTQSSYCSGGNADGFDADPSGIVCLNNQVVYCTGGNADGYHVSTGSSLFGNQGIYCNGGIGDGYHQQVSPSANFGTGIWRGITSNNWNTASNWANNVVPDETIDVMIPDGCSYYPVLPAGDLAVNYASGAFRCKGILIGEGASLINFGYLSVLGNFNVAGQYTAINNNDASQSIGNGGIMILNTGGLISIGDQLSTLGLSDLVIGNGGTLAVYGGSLYIDDQLNILSGGTLTMTDGIVFPHRYGIGSSYGSGSPGSFYIAAGAGGSVTGGMVKVNGKATTGIYSAVGIFSPGFGFSGTAKLKITDGNNPNFDETQIKTANGVTLNNLTIDKPFRTVSLATDVVILGDIVVLSDSYLQVEPGVVVTVEGDLLLME